ncbi:hypothetical protein NUW58_g1674 [Xylaria curta]|uniref:Uncharacterized protein n=1 Tax=Xylaria curta TaxID=42375 RepID=A0ACC1PKI1_9PEZI|nr:hypothetical protein NUW58_g1674 [Xylaria curta]
MRTEHMCFYSIQSLSPAQPMPITLPETLDTGLAFNPDHSLALKHLFCLHHKTLSSAGVLACVRSLLDFLGLICRPVEAPVVVLFLLLATLLAYHFLYVRIHAAFPVEPFLRVLSSHSWVLPPLARHTILSTTRPPPASLGQNVDLIAVFYTTCLPKVHLVAPIDPVRASGAALGLSVGTKRVVLLAVGPPRAGQPKQYSAFGKANTIPFPSTLSAGLRSSLPLDQHSPGAISIASLPTLHDAFFLVLLLLLFIMSICVMVHAVKSLWLILSRYGLLGTYENMSPESSSLFPDRPIRPLPKRRLRERLSPDVADSIKYPPTPQATTPLFVYPYNSREEGSSISTDLAGAITRDNGFKSEADAGFRRNGLAAGRDDDSLMNQARRALGSRGFHEPVEHGFRIPQRSGQPRQPKPQPPPSTASSADGYDSFENTNNKKKRKIPIAGETILNGTHVLSEPAAFGMPSPPTTGDDDSGDHVPTSTPYYQSGGSLSNGQGISGPGRGRYGRIRNGRSPLRALSDSNANWAGRNMKLRTAGQYPSPPTENSGIISTAIASAEKLPVPTGQENISLLQQQIPTKPSPRSSTQFTFTFGSQNPVSWPGSDPTSHGMTGSHRGHQPADGTDYHSANVRSSQPGSSSNQGGSGNTQASAQQSGDNTGKRASNMAGTPKKPKRRGNSLVQAARQRRRETQYQNMHHPPAPEDYYLCEFYRHRRREEAERRRLLEKAKMKSRKGKKASSNNKMPARTTNTADRTLVPPSDTQHPPPVAHQHTHEDGEDIRSEAFDSEDNYDDHISHEEDIPALISDDAYEQSIIQAQAGGRGAGGGPPLQFALCKEPVNLAHGRLDEDPGAPSSRKPNRVDEAQLPPLFHFTTSLPPLPPLNSATANPNAPPKQTSEREVELMKRLRKLEGIVEDLSGQIEFETYKHGSNSESPEAASDMHETDRRKATGSPPVENSSSANNIPPGYSLPHRTATGGSTTSSSFANAKGQHAGDVNKDFGKLVLSEKGKVRYVNNAFWTKITEEIEALRSETQRLTDESSDSSDDEDSPVVADPQVDAHIDHHGFIFGYSSSNVDLRSLHPLPSQMLFYWQVYMENVDPIVKLLHVPAMTKIVKELRGDMSIVTPGVEALMFAIYFAAITSMEADEVMTNFGAEKRQLIARYRFATEQALAKANCVTTQELVVLQAFVLFLILVRRYDDTKFSSALTGLVVKIAQSLGLHRDGTHFDNISPFDIEMRRRLWWAICVLDLRSAEDQGCELTVMERSFDTRFPLNINDNDISPEMTEFPPERIGSTDMTFCLIRYEICGLSRRIHTAASGMAPCPKDSGLTLEEHEEKLLEMYEHIDQKYLKLCPAKETDLLNWVSATIARLIMSKMSLVIYQPLMPSTGTELPSDVRDRLFMASIEVVEYSRVLNAEPKIRRWRWLFQTYNQWHAVAYLLLEVCRRSWSPSVERGWIVLNATFETDKSIDSAKPAIWVLLRKLMIQAKRHRESEIARLRANPQAAEELDIEEHNQLPPASFQHLPSSVRSTLARDRWRKLIGTNGQYEPANNSVAPKTESNSNNTAVSKTASAAPTQTMSKAEVQFNDLDCAMNEPFFSPQDLYPLAFAGNPTNFASQVALNNDVLTAQAFKPPQPSLPIESFDTRASNVLPTQEGLRMETGGGLTDAMTDDNPPPLALEPKRHP